MVVTDKKRGGKRPGSGRKGKDEEMRLIRLIDRAVDDEGWIRIYRAVVARAQAGDVMAAKELADRRFGKVTEKMELSGNAKKPLVTKHDYSNLPTDELARQYTEKTRKA